MKYTLTTETLDVEGDTLYRVKALRDFGNVKAGDLGGFVEREENLSQEGTAWVSENAWVYGGYLIMTGFQRCMLIAIPCSLVLWIIILTIVTYIISLL